jgi:hypothetical protein
MMKTALLAAFLVLVPSVGTAQAPAGWKTERKADEIVMSPPGLKPGEMFALVLQPGLDGGRRPLRAWLDDRVASVGKRIGKQVQDDGTRNLADGSINTARIFRNKKGALVYTMFTAGLRPGGKIGLLSVLCSPEVVCNAHRPEVEKMFARIAGRTEPRAEPREARRADEREAYVTAPGRGVAASDIDAVLVETFTTSGAGGMSFEGSKAILLLKNGDYCDQMDVTPADMNVAAHKQAHPGAWGRWRRAGRKYEVLEDGKWKAADHWKLRLEPARPGQKLTGTFESVIATGLASAAIVSSSSLTFLPGSRFRRGRSVTTTTSSVAASSSEKNEGTYRLDGRTLELRFDDGRVDRRAFHWLDVKKQDAAYFNGVLYLLSK